MSELLWLMVLAPAVAGGVGLLLPGPQSRLSASVAVAGSGIAFFCATAIFIAGDTFMVSYQLANFGDISVMAALAMSPLISVIAMAAAGVATLVQLYSVAYQKEDSRYGPYAAQISLFCAAMLLVVASDDLVLLLIGWEVMGACSYLLIAHNPTLRNAPTAATKAFLVTRFADVGFILGVMLLGVEAGSFRISDITYAAPDMSTGVLTAALVLILLGCVGKSAQFPLHTWLPDAMAGPTPISALIHAATMVAAGAYVLTRLLPIWPEGALIIVAIVAALSMVGAAAFAIASNDIKRVLAWSTVSQVGFMFAAVAVANADAALFHLLTHAAFKALLFLTAGVIIAQTAAGGDLRRTRLSRHDHPVPFWAMTLGLAALVGLPPLSGFWSKEAVLGSAYESATVAGIIVFWAAIVASALTAAYAMRLWLWLFGRPVKLLAEIDGSRATSTSQELQKAPPSPPPPPVFDRVDPLLSSTLWVLLIPTVLVGGMYFAGPFDGLPSFHIDVMALLLVSVIIGAIAAADRWRRGQKATAGRIPGRSGAWRALPFAHGFYLDRIQQVVATQFTKGASATAVAVENHLVDGTVRNTQVVTDGVSRRLSMSHRGGLVAYLRIGAAGIALIAVVVIGVSLWP